jgi:hypothetical protein
MRMTASWYRPLGRPNTSSWRATRARWRAPLGIVAVIDLKSGDTAPVSSRMSEFAAVLAAVKGKSLRDGLRPPLTAAPRSAPTKSGRDEEMSQARSNKEMQLTTPLTPIAPYKSTGGKRAFAKPQKPGVAPAGRAYGPWLARPRDQLFSR